MLRPASCPRPAGVSPVRVDTGVPGSRPRFVVETRRAERGVESLFGGSKIAGRTAIKRESCSLVRSTMGEPSRSCHGEGHVRQTLFRGQFGGSLRGTGERHVIKVWGGTGEIRLFGRRLAKTRGISRW